MKYFVSIEGREVELSVDGAVARGADSESTAHIEAIDGTPVRVATIGDRVRRVIVRRHRTPGRYTILVDGFKFEVEAVDERTRAIRQLAGAAAKPPGPSLLAAPMPGLVVRVLVESGAAVQPGQPLVVIEAMKMENELRAPSAGIVRTVHVGPGTAVEKGAPLVEVEALP